MERFKLNLYKRDFSIDLVFENPTSEEKTNLFNFLIENNIDTNQELFFNSLRNLPYKRNGGTCEKPEEIIELIKSFHITDTNLFLVWAYPTEIDMFNTDYLISNWEYIWYPTSDEAVAIFCPQTKRLLLLTDYGIIYAS